jgi:hypothetical protein
MGWLGSTSTLLINWSGLVTIRHQRGRLSWKQHSRVSKISRRARQFKWVSQRMVSFNLFNPLVWYRANGVFKVGHAHWDLSHEWNSGRAWIAYLGECAVRVEESLGGGWKFSEEKTWAKGRDEKLSFAWERTLKTWRLKIERTSKVAKVSRERTNNNLEKARQTKAEKRVNL